MSEKRFVIHDSSVEEYVESLENRNIQGKTKRGVKLLNDFLRGEKKEERELSAITPEDWRARVKNAVRMRVFPASGANLPLKLYAITKQTRFRPRNSKK